MRQLILFALWWFVAGCIVGLGIQALRGPTIVLWCGSLHTLVGLIGLALVLRNEQARAAFYNEGERGGMPLALLLFLPASAIFLGLIWMVMGWSGWWF